MIYRRLLGSLGALLVVLAVAACGGSDADSLTTYLDEMKREQNAYLQAQRRAFEALDVVDVPEPTIEECRRSGHLLRAARDDYDDLGIRMRGLDPPDELTDAHSRLAKSLQLFAQYLDRVQQDIRDCDFEALEETVSRSQLPDRARELRSDWRVAVSAYAAREGVVIPPWVSEVGKAPK